MVFDRHSNFCSHLNKTKLLAFSNYSNVAICQVWATESICNLAQNCPHHGYHAHDVTNFGQIVKMKDKITIYRNETLQSTKYYFTLAIVTLSRNGCRHGWLVA
jgi:hypothetical protein